MLCLNINLMREKLSVKMFDKKINQSSSNQKQGLDSMIFDIQVVWKPVSAFSTMMCVL